MAKAERKSTVHRRVPLDRAAVPLLTAFFKRRIMALRTV